MPFCPRCGSANADEAKFCVTCGTRLPPPEPAVRQRPITVFYSYSHKDEDLRNELEAHLAPLRRSGLIREWHDRRIIAGQDWDKEISHYLESAELILFLISADFINSNYIFDVEVKRALERQHAGQAAVVPVILRPVLWKIIPEFSRLQALPENARPVTEWPSADLAFVSICEGIVAVVLARASPASDASAPSHDVLLPRRTTSRSRRRILDAALPARVPLTKASTLLVLIRRTDSPGLRAIVEAEPEYDIAAKDIESQPLVLKFPVDQEGTAQPLDLNIRIESPGFEPKTQQKSIEVPPRGDSLPRLFFLTPTQVGPLLVNVEICQGEEMIAGCVLHSVGVEATTGAEELPGRQSVASASLGMPEDEGLAAGSGNLTGDWKHDAEQVVLEQKQSFPAEDLSKLKEALKQQEEHARAAEMSRLEKERRRAEATTLHREKTAYGPPPSVPSPPAPSPQAPDLPNEATEAAPPPPPAPQAPRTLHEPTAARPPASAGPPSGAGYPVPTSAPRRSFLSSTVLRVSVALVAFFVVIIGGNDLLKRTVSVPIESSPGQPVGSAPSSIAGLVVLVVAIAVAVLIFVKLKRR